MVVLSVAVVSSTKTLIARQFVEMTRIRVEGLLSAFPKLLESGRDHTFIETETVRYVYQPMESLYILLVTNRSSNILEDIETLRLLAKVVQDTCQLPVTEELILKHAFDIVFAFDEVVSFGYRESVSLSQVKTYTEMDSHEEKAHLMAEQSKINEAKEKAKLKEKELKKAWASQKKDNSSSAAAFGGGDTTPASGGKSDVSDSLTKANSMTPEPWAMSMIDEDTGPAPIKPKAPTKSMVLGKKKPADIFGVSPGDSIAEPPATTEAVEEPTASAPVVNPLLEPVKVEVEEKVSANLQVEGGLVGEAECVGGFQVTVLDTSKADLVCFKLAQQDQEFKYKVHPNLNKASHAKNILEVRDATRAFKANAPAMLVKWRITSAKEDFLPISLNCWPSSTADGTEVVLEFELQDQSATLEDVHVRFPAPASARPSVASVQPGEASYDAGAQEVHWHIPVIDKDEDTGTLQFTASADTASLLPFTFSAIRRGWTKCLVDIVECYHQERGDAISYLCEKSSTYQLTVGS